MGPMGAHAGNTSGAMASMPGAASTATGAMPDMSGTGTAANGSGSMSSMADGSSPSNGMPGPGGSTAMPSMPGAGGQSGTPTTMPGMGGGTSTGTALSLATTSPAGPITWPLAMGTMEPGMQMVTPNCTTDPTPVQQSAAVALVDQTVSNVARYQSLATAKADGYVPVTPTGLPTVHYVKPVLINDGNTLDPNAIESLVYANTPHGAVLVAAMYLMPSDQVGATPPMPGGCLTEWHVHTNLCFSTTTGAVVGVTHGGTCAPGSTNHESQPMLHVWLAPVPGGPLTVDASPAQVAQAAAALPAPDPANGTA